MSKKKATWIIAGILSVLCFLVFRYYLVFKNAYYFWDICGDGFYYSYPDICGYADYIAQHIIPSWSFKMGMGQNIFPYVLRDPFDIILYLGGSANVLYLTIYVEVIKIILAGILFFRYLKLLGFSFYTSLIGCVLFSFCGFVTEGSAWFCFSFEAFNFALLLLAFELLFIRQKWFLFPFAIFLLCISMPFNLYIYGLFLIFYAILRHFQSGKFDIKKLAGIFTKMFALTLLGILLSGPFFLQNLLLLLNSPRGAASGLLHNQFSAIPPFQVSDTHQLGTAILRFFSNDLLGSGSNFKGWDTIIGAPLFYCGLLCLLILPQIFTFLDKRSRIVFAVFLALGLLPVVFPFFRRAIWLFTGDYYRGYSFFVAFLILYCAVHALEHIFQKRTINYKVLLFTAAALLTILLVHPFIKKDIIDNLMLIFVVCMLCAYTIILALLPKVKNANIIWAILLIAVFFEVFISGDVTANRRDSFSMKWLTTEKVMYRGYALDAIKYIQKNDKTFYRVDKNFDPPTARFTDLNSSQAQGYNSTASYNSFNELYYVKYLQLMGIADKNNEADSRWAIGLLDNPVLESENNVKYFLSVKNYHPAWPAMWDSLTTIGDVTVYKNNFVLPFGYTYDQYITEKNFEAVSPLQKKFITLHAFVIKDKETDKVRDLKEYKLADTTKDALDFGSFKDALKGEKDSLSVTEFRDTKISGTINLKDNKLIYLSIPYDEGWHLYVDGKEQEKIIVNGGMTGALLNRGEHRIEMLYKLKYMGIGMLMTIMGVVIFILAYLSFVRRNQFSKDAHIST